MPDELFNQAMFCHQAGDLARAAELYHQVLCNQPEHPDALNLLGVVARQQHRLDESRQWIERAIAAAPNDARYPFNLGETLRAAGQFAHAIAAYRSSLETNPANAPAWHALGMSYEKLGNHAEALNASRRAVQVDPRLVPAYESLFDCLWRQEKFDEATEVCRIALSIDPNGATRQVQHAAVLLHGGNVAGAMDAYRRAAELRPDWAEPHIGLSQCFDRLGQPREAERSALAAIHLDPQSPRAHVLFGVAQDKQGRGGDAVTSFRQAIVLDPLNGAAHANLSNILADRFQQDEAIALAFRAVELSPRSAPIHSNLLLMLNLPEAVDERMLFDEHRKWSDRYAARVVPAQVARPRENDPDRPLRVGYVSPDFRRHPVASFFEPLLAGHDRTAVCPTLYSDVARPDDVTDRLRSLAGQENWRDTSQMPDVDVAAVIERDRIDILVDLAGHTAGNRLPLFGRGLAPVQVTYLGYPNTTGLPRSVMQCRLTDAHCDPPGQADALHTEELVRLGDSFLCYRPPTEAPPVAPAPREFTGRITFGSFCGMMKIHTGVIRVWANLLRRVKDARLIIKNKAMSDADVRQRVLDAFHSHGISVERLLLRPQDAGVREHLASYADVDIALDTFPYNGTTTSCEALWMGVPVVTLMGEPHRSRVGASLLHHLGLTQLVSNSSEQYIESAANLAEDRSAVCSLRSQIRDRMERSPLRDEHRFVINIERAYRRMWRRAVGEVPG